MHDRYTGFDGKSIRYFRLARHALVAGLELLQLPRGSRVLVPAFICRDLLSSFHALGAEPVFYDVDAELKPILLPDDLKVGAVLAVNYFGFPQDLTIFEDYCKRGGAYLIEDNAHGFLSAEPDGRMLGARGDIGVFSMRKTFVLPDGAALVVNAGLLQDKLPVQLPILRNGLGIAFWSKRVLSFIQRKFQVPVLAWMQGLVRYIRYMRTGHAITPLAEENEFELPPNPSPHQYSIKAIATVDKMEESKRRRSLYEQFQLKLAEYSITPVFPHLPRNTVPYGFPFYASDENAALVVKMARGAGLDCVRWPDLPRAVALTAPAHYRSLWMINFLC